MRAHQPGSTPPSGLLRISRSLAFPERCHIRGPSRNRPSGSAITSSSNVEHVSAAGWRLGPDLDALATGHDAAVQIRQAMRVI